MTKRPHSSPISVGYSRQSRTRQADMDAGRIVSPEMQTDAARAYAASHGWQWDEELTRAAIETNTSGGQSKGDKKRGESSWKKRRGLSLLLEAAQQGRFAHLIVYKLSRLARSAREGLEICDAFERAGVAIHSTSEGIDYSTSTGKMIRTMMLALAEMELENIREFAIEAMYTRAKSGKPHGPWPAWIGRSSDGEFCLLEPVASTYRRLVELRLSGLSYIGICRQLNAEGLTPSEGSTWTHALVSRYLSESYLQRYQGHSHYQSSDLREPLILPGVFPALLSPPEAEALQRVQALAQERYGEGANLGGNNRAMTGYVLTGLAWCPVCGGKLVGKKGPKRTVAGQEAPGARSYVCTRAGEVDGAHPEGQSGRGRRTFLLADMLEGAALVAIASAWGKWGEKLLLPPSPAARPRPSGLRSEESLAVAETRLWAAYESGGIPLETLKTRLAKIEEDRAALAAWTKKLTEPSGWEDAPLVGRLEEAGLRLMVSRLVARIEAPVVFDGVRIDRHNPHPARWATIELAGVLPNGSTRVVVSLHPPRWSGPVHVHFGEGIPDPPAYLPPSQTYQAKVARKTKDLAVTPEETPHGHIA